MKDKYIFINGSRIKDLTGKVYNNLTVVSLSEIKNKYAHWNCKCVCGNKIIVSTKDLIGNRKKSCGCLTYVNTKKKRTNSDDSLKEITQNFVGKKFGKLLVKEFSRLKNADRYYLCQCDCGNYKEVWETNLINGYIKSCGCLGGGKCVDLTGQEFGELVVLCLEKKEGNNKIWKCQCSCGNICYYKTKTLLDGDAKSCGHYKEIEKIKNTKLSVVLNDDKLYKNNTTGIKGVVYNKIAGKWHARIQFQKKTYNLGYYTELKDAAEIRKIAEEKLHGEFLEWYKNEYKAGKIKT